MEQDIISWIKKNGMGYLLGSYPGLRFRLASAPVAINSKGYAAFSLRLSESGIALTL